jgi:hypothetical protein
VQRKVPSLSPAAVWTGPAFDAQTDWRADAEVVALAARLAQRRLSQAEAEAEVVDFAAGLDSQAARARLPLLFAALFETMDAERSAVMAGIERYARRQIAMADAIRASAAEVDALRRAPDVDPEAVAAAEGELNLDIRIFDERRAATSHVCEVPRLIEQRLFTLGRAITAVLPEA